MHVETTPIFLTAFVLFSVPLEIVLKSAIFVMTCHKTLSYFWHPSCDPAPCGLPIFSSLLRLLVVFFFLSHLLLKIIFKLITSTTK
jgi:hypothetical protein